MEVDNGLFFIKEGALFLVAFQWSVESACQELGYLQACGKAICTRRDFNDVETPG